MSNLSVNTITDASGGSTASINGLTPQASNMAATFNRIINGAMTIAQRGSAGGITANGSYISTDRWKSFASGGGFYSVAQSTDAPSGFTNSTVLTVTTADASIAANNYYIFAHLIEGSNFSDLNFGAANAQTVTLSFWIKASIAGTYGGVLTNGDSNRSYPYSYTINAVNTWEYKTITVSGDTTGTWAATTGAGCKVYFDLGSGTTWQAAAGVWTAGAKHTASSSVPWISTSGATFYITGVQLEAGSTTASSFAHENVGDTLQKCQRYYYQIGGGGGEFGFIGMATRWNINTVSYVGINHPQPMRGNPSLSYTGNISINYGGTNTTLTSLGTGYHNRENFRLWYGLNHGVIGSQGECAVVYADASSGFLKFDAEL